MDQKEANKMNDFAMHTNCMLFLLLDFQNFPYFRALVPNFFGQTK
jgi:hypothetical protein